MSRLKLKDKNVINSYVHFSNYKSTFLIIHFMHNHSKLTDYYLNNIYIDLFIKHLLVLDQKMFLWYQSFLFTNTTHYLIL